MRTRSQTSAQNRIVGKRKEGDDCAAHEDGLGRKRRRVQSSSAATEMAEKRCSPCTKKSGPRKRKTDVKFAQGDGASNRETDTAPEQEMTRCSLEVAEVPCSAPTPCREDVEITSCGIVNELGPEPAQSHSIEQCSSVFQTSLLTVGNVVQPSQEYLPEQGIGICEKRMQHSEIVETAVSPSKLAQTQSEKSKRKEAISTPRQKGGLKRSCTTSMKLKDTPLQSHSAPKKKQMKNIRKANSVPIPMKSSKPNLKGIRAAKLRWMHLMQSIINDKFPPGCTSVDDKLPRSGAEQTMIVENCSSDKTQSLRKKRKRRGEGSPSAAQHRAKRCRQQPKKAKQLRRLLTWIKTWLIQAKFSKVASTNGQSSNDMGEAFIMTEDERNSFAKTMAKSCQQNENLRTIFLESVRVLMASGLIHAAATTLLQEETCEQAHMLMDAWAESKGNTDAARPLPINLLKAVNELHETRGDLSTKLTTSEDSFGLKRLDEKTWKFNVPTLPLPKPIVTKNSRENNTPV